MARAFYDIVVRNGFVVTDRGVLTADVAVRAGRVVEVAPRVMGSANEEFDATGCHVVPGAIDAHVHFGVSIQGQESCDDHSSGTLAAICGGVTCCGDFTVQEEETPQEAARRRLDEMGEVYADVFLHANVTKMPRDLERSLVELRALGVGSVKVFMAYQGMRLSDDEIVRLAEAASSQGMVVMVHAEDDRAVRESTARLLERGARGAERFFDSRPVAAEVEAIRRLGSMSSERELEFYVVHLSSISGLREALEQRRRGARLVLETCPQYLRLARPTGREDSALLSCAPPVRDEDSARQLEQALAAGHLDVLATDHCPFTTAQKLQGIEDFTRLPGGLPGVETLLPLTYDLVLRGRLSLERMVDCLASKPARIFGLQRKGKIAPGMDADLVVLDRAGSTVVSASRLHSRTDYSPSEGLRLRGRVRFVFLRGRLVARERDGWAEPVGEPNGRFIEAA